MLSPFRKRERGERGPRVATEDREEALSKTIDLEPGEYSVVSGMFAAAERVAEATVEEPIELSSSDCQVEEPVEPDTQPRNRRISFGEILAAEIKRTLASSAPPPESQPFTAPQPEERRWDLRRKPLPAGLGVERERTPPRTRRRSNIPLATLLLGLAIAGGLVRDAYRAGRLDHAVDVAASLVGR